MSSDPQPRQELLERLLRSELDPTSPEARAAFLEDPALKAEYDWIRAAERSLDAGVEFERAILDEARRGARAEDEDLVRAVLGRDRLEGSTREPRRWSRAAVAAAAAVLLAVPLVWVATHRPPTAAPGPAPDTLGVALTGLAPAGAVEDYARFTWRGELPPGGSFEVVIQGPDGAERARSPRLAEPHWEPGPQSADWPSELRWEVHLFDGTDRWLGSQSARCSRSSD